MTPAFTLKRSIQMVEERKMAYEQKLQIRERRKREREREKLTRFICAACRKANEEKRTHPGAQHMPGICDCPCR
jgi:hypothetical protein